MQETQAATDAPVAAAAAAPAAPSRASWGRLREVRYLGVAALLVVMIVAFEIVRSDFLSSANVVNLLGSTSILGLVSLGLTFVMIAGQFDLSVGATLSVCGFVFAGLYSGLGIPALPSALLTIAAGAAIGAGVSGVLVGRFNMSFLVVTLGMLVFEDGIVEWVSGGSSKEITSQFMNALAFNSVAGVPVVVIVVVVAFLFADYFLRHSFFGRDVYAVGGNPLAAELSGVSVVRTLILVFAIAGAGAALGSVVQVARIGAASPAVGGFIVFEATAAVLLGGAALSGGVGSVAGTAVGVLFLGVLQNGLTLSGLPSYSQQIATGAIVVCSVLINQRASLRSRE